MLSVIIFSVLFMALAGVLGGLAELPEFGAFFLADFLDLSEEIADDAVAVCFEDPEACLELGDGLPIEAELPPDPEPGLPDDEPMGPEDDGPVCNCFPAGTGVETEDGSKSIEEVKVGDKVRGRTPTPASRNCGP